MKTRRAGWRNEPPEAWDRIRDKASAPSKPMKRGRDLVVGDIIRVISRFERILALEPYDGVNRFLDGPEPARIARFPNGAGMTIFPNDWCEMEA